MKNKWFQAERTNITGIKLPTDLWLKFRDVFSKKQIKRERALEEAIKDYVEKSSEVK
jgi:hypothetical protein